MITLITTTTNKIKPMTRAESRLPFVAAPHALNDDVEAGVGQRVCWHADGNHAALERHRDALPTSGMGMGMGTGKPRVGATNRPRSYRCL